MVHDGLQVVGGRVGGGAFVGKPQGIGLGGMGWSGCGWVGDMLSVGAVVDDEDDEDDEEAVVGGFGRTI